MSTEFTRIERKVDDLTEAINRLVLFEERQAVQTLALANLTQRVSDTEDKLAMWVNRGVGAWAFILIGFSIYKALPL